MNILLLYPCFPPTYWGYDFVLEFTGNKGFMPPLGLLTIAALTPRHHDVRLVDLNCHALESTDIAWADCICFSAMITQKQSLFETAQICRAHGKPVVFGGPYPTACPEECKPHCDVMVCNEGEITWPLFLRDMEAGHPKPIYTTAEKPDLRSTPVPRFDLIDIRDYVSIPIQFSRGCPFQCEFCDIIFLFGRRPRTKTPEQIMNELQSIYDLSYRGQIFIVDDNFIGNKKEVKKLAKHLVSWNEQHGNPFYYGTEASINLADDPELLRLLVKANFLWVFIGIETPSEGSLREAGKSQNLKGPLIDKVSTIQKSGLIVYGGFIIGFDADDETIFARQREFITKAAIPNAMVGPLVALPGSALHRRMQEEDRLLTENEGMMERTVASGYTNIKTRILEPRLMSGYTEIMHYIYDPDRYFMRVVDVLCRIRAEMPWMERWRRFLWLKSFSIERMESSRKSVESSSMRDLRLIYRILCKLPESFRWHSLIFLLRVVRKCPDQLPMAIPFILMGYHSFMFTNQYVVSAQAKPLCRLSRESG